MGTWQTNSWNACTLLLAFQVVWGRGSQGGTCRSRLIAARPIMLQRDLAPARARPSSITSAVNWMAWYHTCTHSMSCSPVMSHDTTVHACSLKPSSMSVSESVSVRASVNACACGCVCVNGVEINHWRSCTVP